MQLDTSDNRSSRSRSCGCRGDRRRRSGQHAKRVPAVIDRSHASPSFFTFPVGSCRHGGGGSCGRSERREKPSAPSIGRRAFAVRRAPPGSPGAPFGLILAGIYTPGGRGGAAAFGRAVTGGVVTALFFSFVLFSRASRGANSSSRGDAASGAASAAWRSRQRRVRSAPDSGAGPSSSARAERSVSVHASFTKEASPRSASAVSRFTIVAGEECNEKAICWTSGRAPPFRLESAESWAQVRKRPAGRRAIRTSNRQATGALYQRSIILRPLVSRTTIKAVVKGDVKAGEPQ